MQRNGLLGLKFGQKEKGFGGVWSMFRGFFEEPVGGKIGLD